VTGLLFLYYPADGVAWWVFGINPDEFDAMVYEIK